MLPIPDSLSLRALRRAAAAIIMGAVALALAGRLHTISPDVAVVSEASR